MLYGLLRRFVYTPLLLPFIIVLSSSQNAFASHTGTFASDRWGRPDAGVVYSYGNDRDMKPQDKENFVSFRVNHQEEWYGIISHPVLKGPEWDVNLNLRLGAARFDTKSMEPALGQYEEISYDWGFLWGLGGDFQYRFTDQWWYVTDINFQSSHHEVTDVMFNGLPAYNITGSEEADVYQTELSLLFGYDFMFKTGASQYKISPYGGLLFSWQDIDAGDLSYETDEIISADVNTGAHEDDVVGLLCGAQLTVTPLSMVFKVEGRLVAEKTLSLSAYYLY